MPEDKGQKTEDVAVSNPQSTIRNPQSQERLWRMRDAVIAWRLWAQDGQAYAVEIHSHVKQRVDKFLKEKLANSQVFFVQGLVKEGEIR